MINPLDVIQQATNIGLELPKVVAEGVLGANDKQVGGTYYKDMGIEPWDVVDTWPLEQRIGVYRHGALKYIMRMGTKDENVQEIQKGIHYLEKLVETLKS
jgi:hypothetical protein